MYAVRAPVVLSARAQQRRSPVARARVGAVRVQATYSSQSTTTVVKSSLPPLASEMSDAELAKVEIKWGRTGVTSAEPKYEFDGLYRSGLPDEAVKVATDGMTGALAYWIRQQQIVAEQATQAVVLEKLKAQRALLAAEFEKDKQAALAAQRNDLESKFAADMNALKSAHERETKDLLAEIERLKGLLAKAKQDYDDMKRQYEDQLTVLKSNFAKREKELLDEIERLKRAVQEALGKANAKYEEAAKQLEAALNLPIGAAVARFKEIIDNLMEYQKQALTGKF